MSPFGLSKLGALAFSVESLCGRLRGKKRGRQAQKTRRLLFDPLEQRQLLSVSPVQTTDTLVNNAVGATGQTTELTTGGVGTYNLPLDNQSVATDDNGDFVVTWTSYNPLINPNTGKQVISATSAPVVEGNIYARYYTDDVQRITLPSAILTQHASGTYGSFQLVYNGSEQQELAITATTAPFGGPVDLAGTFRLGFDPNGKAPTPSEQVTISYNETDPLQTTAGDIQTALSGLGGPLTDVSVSAVNAPPFSHQFRPRRAGQSRAADRGRPDELQLQHRVLACGDDHRNADPGDHRIDPGDSRQSDGDGDQHRGGLRPGGDGQCSQRRCPAAVAFQRGRPVYDSAGRDLDGAQCDRDAGVGESLAVRRDLRGHFGRRRAVAVGGRQSAGLVGQPAHRRQRAGSQGAQPGVHGEQSRSQRRGLAGPAELQPLERLGGHGRQRLFRGHLGPVGSQFAESGERVRHLRPPFPARLLHLAGQRAVRAWPGDPGQPVPGEHLHGQHHDGDRHRHRRQRQLRHRLDGPGPGPELFQRHHRPAIQQQRPAPGERNPRRHRGYQRSHLALRGRGP